MGTTLSKIPPEIFDLFFLALQTTSCTETPYRDRMFDAAINRPDHLLYPTLLSLRLVSQDLNRLVTPLLYREVVVDLGKPERLEKVERAFVQIPDLASHVWRVHVTDSRRRTEADDDYEMTPKLTEDEVNAEEASVSKLVSRMEHLKWMTLEYLWDFRVASVPDAMMRVLETVSHLDNLRRLDLIGMQKEDPTVAPLFSSDACPKLAGLEHLALHRTRLPDTFISANHLPSLELLQYSCCRPTLTQVTNSAPLLRQATFDDFAAYIGPTACWLCGYEETKDLLSGIFDFLDGCPREGTESENSSDATLFAPLDFVEINLMWNTQLAGWTEEFKSQSRNKNERRPVNRMLLSLYMDNDPKFIEELGGDAAEALKVAKALWAREGTDLEVEWYNRNPSFEWVKCN